MADTHSPASWPGKTAGAQAGGTNAGAGNGTRGVPGAIEEAPEAIAEYAQAIVETMPDMLLVMDPDLYVQAANPAFYETFQVIPSETEGVLVYDLGNGQWNIPELRTLLEEVLPDNKVFTGYEVTHTFENLGQRTILLNGRRLDHVQLILLIMVDITERRQSQEALRQLTETLEQQVAERTAEVRRLANALALAEQEERTRLSQVLHDDLQQLLYSARLRAQRLGGREAQEDAARMAQVEQIAAQLETAIRLTRSLVAELNPPVLETEGLPAALVWLSHHMREMYNLSVEVTIAEPCEPASRGAHTLLVQMTRELLFNVVKHAGTGQARVRLERDGAFLSLRIEDDGVGFNVEAALQAEALPSGYGLRSIAERMNLLGGRLEATSAPGNGARITLVVPCKKADDPTQE